MEAQETAVKEIGSLFAGYQFAVAPKKRTSERSELVRYFFENAEKDWSGRGKLKPSYVAFRLSHLSLQDLYAFKSQCEDRRRTGYSWSKYFWGVLKSG